MRTGGDATEPETKEEVMKVGELMTSTVESCTPETDLGTAAMVMWRRDCGVVPVVNGTTQKTLGVITDRDICMALATSGRRPGERRVGEIMTGRLLAARPKDNVQAALELMEREQVRRLPVVNSDGTLQGMLSLNDIVLATHVAESSVAGALSPARVMKALRAICRHRAIEVKAGAGAEAVPELVGADAF